MTALLSGLHATNVKHRDSIIERGLLPASPAVGRPFGIYVFSDDHSYDHPAYNSRCVWCRPRWADLWRVGYFGPARFDQYVMNALILLDRPQLVTLITGHN